MTDLLLSPELQLVFFLCSVFFAVLTVRRQKLLWAVLSALCCVCFCLFGLAADRSLRQLLTAVLIPTMIILHAQAGKKGGGKS